MNTGELHSRNIVGMLTTILSRVRNSGFCVMPAVLQDVEPNLDVVECAVSKGNLYLYRIELCEIIEDNNVETLVCQAADFDITKFMKTLGGQDEVVPFSKVFFLLFCFCADLINDLNNHIAELFDTKPPPELEGTLQEMLSIFNIDKVMDDLNLEGMTIH